MERTVALFERYGLLPEEKTNGIDWQDMGHFMARTDLDKAAKKRILAKEVMDESTKGFTISDKEKFAAFFNVPEEFKYFPDYLLKRMEIMYSKRDDCLVLSGYTPLHKWVSTKEAKVFFAKISKEYQIKKAFNEEQAIKAGLADYLNLVNKLRVAVKKTKIEQMKMELLNIKFAKTKEAMQKIEECLES